MFHICHPTRSFASTPDGWRPSLTEVYGYEPRLEGNELDDPDSFR